MAPVGMEPAAGRICLERLDLSSFNGRSVAVLGLARSGIALCRFLVDQGARVTVYDVRPMAELGEAIAALEGRPVELLLGPGSDPADALQGRDLICTSPSISSSFPTSEPRLRAALAAIEAEGATPVVSEIDLFLRLCAGMTIGVTGTKGKTTTSALTAAILGAGASPVLLGGNIGTPLIEDVPGITADHRVVIELSELQLPTLSRGTDVAVYTHVTADHLDRHGSLAAYRTVKRRLAELLPPDGSLILNADDPVTHGYAGLRPPDGRLVRYRLSRPGRGEVGVEDGWIVADGVPALSAGVVSGRRVMPLDELAIPGAHNVSNVLAATAVGLVMGIPTEGIRRAVGAFHGVEHRLEQVATIDGVRFVNDSMGTQPDAVVAALHSFPPPIVLICGGRAKDVPIDELVVEVARRTVAAVCIGESGPVLCDAFSAAGLARTEVAPDLTSAVRRADAIGRELLGDGASRPVTVLLSPAAASFDMFADYAERGRAFKAAVAAIAADERGARREGP